MPLTLHYHPLASFCWKALVGLYELEVPFEKHLVDLSDADARAAFARLWPLAKFPVLRDEERGRTVPESTILLEYVDRLSDGPVRLIPQDPERALECRLRDRLFDTYVHAPLQKIVGDRLRPASARDALGVEPGARAAGTRRTRCSRSRGSTAPGRWAPTSRSPTALRCPPSTTPTRSLRSRDGGRGSRRIWAA